MEELIRAQRLLAQQFRDAPKELNATIDLAMNALKNDSFGESRNELNRAQKLVEENNLEDWDAEVSAAWAVFYHRTDEVKEMYQAISRAMRLEPDNKRIEALREVLLSE